MNSNFPTFGPSSDFEPARSAASHAPSEVRLSIEAVQRHLNRSRASVYRYANTDPNLLNPPYDPQKLNPEIRRDKDAPLEFRPQEVQRFAEEVLGLNPVIQVQPPTETVTTDLLRQVLQELQAIRTLLETQRGKN